MGEKIYWLANSEQDKKYDTTTWYRCVGIEKFLAKVEEKAEIVAFIMDDNNIGFVLSPK
jgi:hypothetical protein